MRFLGEKEDTTMEAILLLIACFGFWLALQGANKRIELLEHPQIVNENDDSLKRIQAEAHQAYMQGASAEHARQAELAKLK